MSRRIVLLLVLAIALLFAGAGWLDVRRRTRGTLIDPAKYAAVLARIDRCASGPGDLSKLRWRSVPHGSLGATIDGPVLAHYDDGARTVSVDAAWVDSVRVVIPHEAIHAKHRDIGEGRAVHRGPDWARCGVPVVAVSQVIPRERMETEGAKRAHGATLVPPRHPRVIASVVGARDEVSLLCLHASLLRKGTQCHRHDVPLPDALVLRKCEQQRAVFVGEADCLLSLPVRVACRHGSLCGCATSYPGSTPEGSHQPSGATRRPPPVT